MFIRGSSPVKGDVLVNVDHILAVFPHVDGTACLKMQDGSTILTEDRFDYVSKLIYGG